MNTVTELRAAKVAIEVAEYLGPELVTAIEFGLWPEGPVGSPSVISSRAADYARAAIDAEGVAATLREVGAETLPAAWVGVSAVSAGNALHAVATEMDGTVTTLRQAQVVLTDWAAELSRAQAEDQRGRESLDAARRKLGFAGLELWHLREAARTAREGIRMRVSAAETAQTVGERTASTLRQLDVKARAERANTASLDPLSKVVLASAMNPGGWVDGGPILSPNALARGGELLDAMSAADRAEFEGLLNRASTPQEAAYLWKALATGRPITQLRAFAAAIHPKGTDPVWLAEHLTPKLNDGPITVAPSSMKDVTYKGEPIYSQGAIGDCVAASTIVAQASVDPVMMLQLTTGGTTTGDDTPAAVQARLQHAYVSAYVEGQRADGVNPYPATDKGVAPTGETLLANKDLGASSGQHYSYQPLLTASQRHDALTHIEMAVDSGVPVPIDVTGGGDGHQMMIVGRDGDRLEIYNPWGETGWVTEDQFVHDQLGGLSDPKLHTADGLELPR